MLALPRNHELAEHKQISLRDLKAVPFIWSRCQTVAATSDGLIGACRAAGFTPSIAHHVDSECTKTCLVAAGEGVGFVLSGACTPVDNVAFREVQDLAVEVRLNLVWRKQQLTMQLRRFLEIVKRVGAARRQEASRRPHPGAACP
jgi:DNA-binding transcriptional LysR family regulator